MKIVYRLQILAIYLWYYMRLIIFKFKRASTKQGNILRNKNESDAVFASMKHVVCGCLDYCDMFIPEGD